MFCMSKDDGERESVRGRRVLAQTLRVAGYLFFVYATTYFLVMDTKVPARSVTGKPVYGSAFMFGRPWAQPCWANQVFWPMDCLVQPWLKPCNKFVEEEAYREGQDEYWDKWWREHKHAH
jgi:hypothetical protein